MKYILVYRKRMPTVKTAVTTCIFTHAVTAVYSSIQNMYLDNIQASISRIINVTLQSTLFL